MGFQGVLVPTPGNRCLIIAGNSFISITFGACFNLYLFENTYVFIFGISLSFYKTKFCGGFLSLYFYKFSVLF